MEDHQRTLQQWNEQRVALETKLARQISDVRLQQHVRDVNRQAVARKLPPDAAIVEIVHFNVFDFQAVAERLDESHWRPPRQWQPARYLAFVLRAARREDGSRGLDGDGESPCEMIDLGEAEPIDKLVSGFQSRIVGRHRGLSFGDAKSPDAANEAGRSLRAAVFDPIARRLDDCRRLLLVPDGALSMLPFEVLPTGDGGRLIDDHQVSYVTTGRDVLRFGRATTGAVTETLVVADPDYDLCADEGAETRESGAYLPSPGRLSRAFPRNGTTFQRLRATEKEGQRIAAMLGTQRLWLRDAALDFEVSGRKRAAPGRSRE